MEAPGLFSGLTYAEAQKKIRSLKRGIVAYDKKLTNLNVKRAAEKNAYQADLNNHSFLTGVGYTGRAMQAKISAEKHRMKHEALSKDLKNLKAAGEAAILHKDLRYWEMFADATVKGRKLIVQSLKEWDDRPVDEKQDKDILHERFDLEARLAVADRMISWESGVNRMVDDTGKAICVSKSLETSEGLWACKVLYLEADEEYRAFKVSYAEFQQSFTEAKQNLIVKTNEFEKLYDGVPVLERDPYDIEELQELEKEIDMMDKMKIQLKLERLMYGHRIADLHHIVKNHPLRQ